MEGEGGCGGGELLGEVRCELGDRCELLQPNHGAVTRVMEELELSLEILRRNDMKRVEEPFHC